MATKIEGDSVVIRRMTAADLPGCVEVQRVCYPGYYQEGIETYQHRLSAYPEGCFVAVSSETNAVIGYGQSFPWTTEDLAPCGIEEVRFREQITRIRGLVNKAAYHVHDVATTSSGKGVGSALFLSCVNHAIAEGYARAQLIAVLGMQAVWSRPQFGFTPAHHSDTATLESYAYGGVPACYMVRQLKAAADGAQ